MKKDSADDEIILIRFVLIAIILPSSLCQDSGN